MIGNLSRREHVIIALGTIAAVVILGWVYVVQPVRDNHRVAAELVPARADVLERRRQLVARKAAIAAELDTMNARIQEVSARFLPAGTSAVAASELQKLVKEMATQAATEVRSERILPTVERGELTEIPIEIAVSGEVRQLVDLLARFERAPKLLAVQDLKIRVVNITQPKDLLVTFTVAGFIPSVKSKT
jgi:Tfp pilus assembly protein PilO